MSSRMLASGMLARLRVPEFAVPALRKLIAIAEVFRRNPEDGFEPEPGADARRWCTSSPGTSWPSRWASPAPRPTGC